MYTSTCSLVPTSVTINNKRYANDTRTQHEQVVEPDSQSPFLEWQVTFIKGFLVCNSATFRSGKTNRCWSEGWASGSPQSDPLVFVNCCFAGVKNTLFFHDIAACQETRLGDFKSWYCVIFLLCRPKETSVGHPKGDGVGTDGLSSLSGLPWRFRWTHCYVMLSNK